MPDLFYPPEIELALRLGAILVISISGGKDSQLMLNRLVREYYRRCWTVPLATIHADLGRAEWKQTPAFVRHLAFVAGLPLIVVRRPQGDLVQEIQDRMLKLSGTDKPFWPSSQQRYCTADQKRGQIDRFLRAPFWPSSQQRYCTSHHKTAQIDKFLRLPAWPDEEANPWQEGYNPTAVVEQFTGQASRLIISAEGIRADESRERAKKQPISVRKSISAEMYAGLSAAEALDKWQGQQQPDLFGLNSGGGRLALNWYPIFEWSEAQVYEGCGHSLDEVNERRAWTKEGRVEEALADWTMHVAYPLGSTRLSCAICVLGSLNDITVGATHNPELLYTYQDMEIVGGKTFKNGWSLQEIKLLD
ncbi:MAG: phosphoadenosine phosphosulfate reductase family protein [Anaerolineae bacterium]|nr:phosphoadenosine phosphosulfate reductase family protein [Anaerolineae bacterium]